MAAEPLGWMCQTYVSTLVLMDSWINGCCQHLYPGRRKGFNPCFNGFMDKWWKARLSGRGQQLVSTLVLMDSWINGHTMLVATAMVVGFNPCFNGFMDKWGVRWH